jgi:hypothetical protein
MNNQRIKFHLSVDPDFDEAITSFGFDSRQHFFRQCTKAVMSAYKSGDKLDWPMAFRLVKFDTRQNMT